MTSRIGWMRDSTSVDRTRRPSVTSRSTLRDGAAVVGAILLGVTALATPAWTDPIVVVGGDPFNPFAFLDARSANTAGVSPGARVTVGVDVTPNPRFNGDLGTAVTAVQGALALPLVYLDSPALPNQFANSTACPPPCGLLAPPPPALQGNWQLHDHQRQQPEQSPGRVYTRPRGDHGA